MFRALCVLLLVVAIPAQAGAQSSEARLAWDASVDSSVTGYVLEYGTAAGVYSKSINVGLRTEYTVQGLTNGKTYYFAVRAHDSENDYSVRSNVVILATPAPCSTAFSTSAQTVASFGANASFTLWTGAGCAWTLASSADWVTLSPADLGGSNSKMITYSVAGNPSPDARTAILYSGNRSVIVTQPGRVRGDFNGDGHVDLLWQNRSTGEVSLWRMKGTTIDRGDYLTPANVGDTNWKIAGTLDADLDGHTDIVFQHDTGHVAIWRMSGEQRVENIAVGTNVTDTQWDPRSDPRWRIVGTGDMDRDGFDDILWQHADGRVAAWYMDAIEVREVALIATVSDDRWRVAATDDFNGDGKVDILWRHTTWGQFLVWNMDDRNYLSSGMHLIMASSQWQVSGVGDFDRDGETDLIWWNSVTGELAAWLLKNQEVASSLTLNPGRIEDTNWRIAGPR
jgi:hypothetical protein